MHGFCARLWCTTLYLNIVLLQFLPQLRRAFVMNRVHAQAPRIFQVQRPVVDEPELLPWALSALQRDEKNRFLRLARVQITRAEKHLEVSSQSKRFDAVFVQLQRFVVDRADKIFSGSRRGVEHGARLRVLLRLREHERREFFPCEPARPVEQRAVEILIQRNVPGIKRRKRKVVAILKFFPIQAKRLGRFAPRPRVPAIGQDDPADVPKQRRDFRQRATPPPCVPTTTATFLCENLLPLQLHRRPLRVFRKACCRICRSEEHTSELQSHLNLVCRLLLEKKKKNNNDRYFNECTV